MEEIDYRIIAGKKLQRFLKDNGYTQEAFAYEYGYSVKSINRYVKKGINKIDTIQELAAKLKVPFFDFFIDK